MALLFFDSYCYSDYKTNRIGTIYVGSIFTCSNVICDCNFVGGLQR